jgi:hypothetical protein
LDKNDAVEIAILMYANEPCRICGRNMTPEDVKTAVFAGYSKNDEARTAHRECRNKLPPPEPGVPHPQWFYQ